MIYFGLVMGKNIDSDTYPSISWTHSSLYFLGTDIGSPAGSSTRIKQEKD